MIRHNENYIIFNGTSTKDMFLIEELPLVPVPELKQEFIEIQGRHGFLTQSEDAYMPIDYDIEFKVYKKEDLQKIRNLFRGSGTLILSHDTTKYYKARVQSQITMEREILHYYNVQVSFKLQPHAYEIDANKKNISSSTSSPMSITNNTNATCQPLITITGTGSCSLIVGSSTINISNIGGSITLDFEMQEAYTSSGSSKTNRNTDVSGDFPEVNIGSTRVSWSGSGVTRVEINKRLRWL